MLILPGISFLLMGVLFLFSYISTKKNKRQFKKSQYRTEGVVFGKNIKLDGNFMKVRLKFVDRDGNEWQCISQPFRSLKEEFEPDAIVSILFAERKTKFGTIPEVKVVDKRYAKKSKVNHLYVLLTMSIVSFVLSAAVFALGIIL